MNESLLYEKFVLRRNHILLNLESRKLSGLKFPQNVLNIVLLIDVFLSITYLRNYFNYIRTCNY